MHFCPRCGNLLLVEEVQQTMRMCCETCPFQYRLVKNIASKVKLTKKVVDDVLGGSDAWQNVDKTSAKCPETGCGGDEAYFMQIQIRSADEPMTTFYRCCKCSAKWSDR